MKSGWKNTNKILFNYILGMAVAIIGITVFYRLMGHKIVEMLYHSNLWINLLMRHRNEWSPSLYFERYDAYFISILWAMVYFLVWGSLFIILLKSIAHRQKRYLIYLLALGIIVFSIIGFELGAKSYFRHRGFLFLLTPSTHNYLPYLVFGDGTQRLNLHGSYKNIYEIGLKASQNYPVKKRKNTFRIFFLGASVAGDIEKEDIEKRYYVILEKKLNNYAKDRLSFECISAGVGAYISNQELIWLEVSGLLDMEPDMVVIFDGYNDVASVFPHRTEIGYPYVYTSQRKQLESISYYLFVRCLRYSAFLRYISLQRPLQRDSLPYKDDKKLFNLIAVNYVKNIEKMCALINSFCPEAKIIVALQPLPIFKKHLAPVEKIIVSNSGGLQNLKKTYSIIFDYLKKSVILRHRNVAIVDMMNVFDHTTKKIYHDPCHFGEEGSAILAEKFYNLIKDSYL